MDDIIQSIFCNPPIAIARLGGSSTPAAAHAWVEPPNPRSDGDTVAVPQWSLGVLSDGSVDPFRPQTLTFRDGDLIRPVCPFIEVWARVGPAGSPQETWRDVPLTPALLKQSDADESSLSFSVDARNRKAARRRKNPGLMFGTFPAVQIAGDHHVPVPLLAVSPPDARPPMIPPGNPIPLGFFQVLRSRPQPASNSALWAGVVDTEVIRVRFTPAKGLFYGPARSDRPTEESEVPAVTAANSFLNADAGWYGERGAMNPFVQPGDTFDSTTEGGPLSLGVVDDTCEAQIKVELSLKKPKRLLSARANVFVAPPDFAPDRRPFLSLADELNDREANAAARNAEITGRELEAWVEDLFGRIYETVSLLNVDALHATSTIKLSGERLAEKPIANDHIEPVDRALGSQDKLRNRDYSVAAVSAGNPLPISEHARTRHFAMADIAALKGLLAANKDRLRQLVRGPFEVEAGESDVRTTMRMPPFMRQSNAMPLTLSAWQYDLLMRWAEEANQPLPEPVALAAGGIQKPPGALSEAAEKRRAVLLDRLNRR